MKQVVGEIVDEHRRHVQDGALFIVDAVHALADQPAQGCQLFFQSFVLTVNADGDSGKIWLPVAGEGLQGIKDAMPGKERGQHGGWRRSGGMYNGAFCRQPLLQLCCHRSYGAVADGEDVQAGACFYLIQPADRLCAGCPGQFLRFGRLPAEHLHDLCACGMQAPAQVVAEVAGADEGDGGGERWEAVCE